MTVCSERGCVSLAGESGICAVHAAGFKKHDGTRELLCDNCRREIKKDEWYRRPDEISFLHAAKACRTHPDVIREREAATEKATA
jgi:hypothetical protein